MSDVCKAQITFVNPASFSILLLNGDWMHNVYEIPLREEVDKREIIEVIVNMKGSVADWAHPE